MWHFAKSKILYFMKAKTSKYLVNVFICPFLIIHRPPALTGTAIDLRCHIFLNFCFQVIVFILLYSLTRLALIYQLEGMFFFRHYIWTIALYFSIGFDSKILEYSDSFGFCYGFWLVIIPFFRSYSIVSAYFPISSCLSLYSIDIRME